MGRESEAVTRRIRTSKADSAFIYNVFESHEGIVSYSTLPHEVGDPHRDLELTIPVAFVGEVEDLIRSLGEMVRYLD